MIEMLRNRRSIRKYQQKKIEPEKIEILKEALLRSPTSRHRNAWKFWFVQDEAFLSTLSRSKKSGSALVEYAPLAVVIGADTTKTDVWVEDCSIAAILLQLTAQSLGLGSCWVQTRLRKTARGQDSSEYVKEALGLPNEVEVEAIVAIGYPDEVKDLIPFDDLTKDAIFDM